MRATLALEGDIMQQEIHFATFNVCNLALPGVRFYDNMEPYTPEQYEAKVNWIAQRLDMLDADVIGLQEIFSQAALKDVLARTQKYRQALQLGLDPDAQANRLTPSVALVSRLPIVSNAVVYTDLPRKLSVALPDVAGAVDRFTRPILYASIRLSDALTVGVFVVHLKSKCPDYQPSEDGRHPSQFGVAALRSLIRRGTDALGLRYLIADRLRTQPMPIVVMGDFNDVIGSVTTQIVMGTCVRDETAINDQLFDSYRIQSRPLPARNVGYTNIFEGNCETIDHILVSDAFNPASRAAIGEVLDVTYLNDHLSLQQPEASDHGIVRASIRLFPAEGERHSSADTK
jgi:endonuclease/exonuclease/phosphatase family metal-dependent hydrolase